LKGSRIFPDRKVTIEMTDGLLIPARSEKSVFSAWLISFIGAIAIFITLPLLPMKINPYMEVLKVLPQGILNTFIVTLLSISVALLVGFMVGLGRISRNGIINQGATIYVEVIRGIPLLVHLFYIYYALGHIIQVPRLAAAVIAMGVCYGAYIGEIFRAGIQSISRGQYEAAISLGMTRSQALRYVMIPQTIKIILPPLGNEFIALLKDSSLVSIVAVSDLLRSGREYASTSFYYFETYSYIAIVYLILTLFLSRLVGIMEERLKRNER